MILNQDGNISLITQEKATFEELVKKIQDSYSKIKNNNIIVNITSLNTLRLQDILAFSELSNNHRKSKHSFVLVSDKVALNNVPDEIIVVPTIQEAYDIIEMEEMERDLGF
ncbi:MAG: ribonuclease Z [Flavobacteriales bacterium]|nr:ribonuclease Z [Flavobacteriia bacterium]NCP06717.1 ribonuclease Z [Flavobacteriales bacterium]PIV92794.1 MAG: ribonuclease Z [Flavobacteriaceae bacterium CG17_big_fil_post_rev_8_21_14_2_50_33_15]PIY11441.1 MAG: ribonuclease Z [Flavobacteriaceae bacterium CG_4_10_14_3_um_filter_33_47]PJB18045.1 MAG: ribonuclease Z [Flavobacteriaceae bacterium CG_4_9_14_3_um_filter_33_16]